MVIDVHGHYIPKGHLGAFPELFHLTETETTADLCVRGTWIHLHRGLFNLPIHIEDMEQNGIDQRYLAIYPYCFYYDKEESVEWCKAYNDGVIADIEPYGDKFRLLANLPMRHVEEACKEMERVMQHPSVVGVQVATNVAGQELDDPAFEEFWALAEKLGAFILVHPSYVIADQRFKQFHLKNLIGNPLDTTIAAFRIIVGGILERHPNLKICLSHAGGYLPFALPRFEHGRQVRKELEFMDKTMDEIALNFYYDTIIYDPETLEFAMGKLGADRFMLGSDYPFDMADAEPVKIVNACRLSEQDRKAILGDTVSEIVKK